MAENMAENVMRRARFSLSSKWVNKGGEIKNKPTVNAKVYAENSGKDRDKDGIACEN